MRGRITADGLDDALAALNRLAGDLPRRALADALNHTANQARQALRAEMASVFDRPTPWVLNSTRIIPAQPKQKVIEAVVTVKDADLGRGKGRTFDDWFAAQVYGGARLTKGSEKMLRQKGILRPGQFVAPTEHTPRDRTGGISREFMTQVLSGLGAWRKSGSDHNATDSKRSQGKGHAKAFFVIKRGRVPIGIGERREWGPGSGNKFKVVLLFTRSKPVYKALFKFHDVVRRVAENDGQLEANIDKAIADALNGRLPSNFNRRARNAAGEIIR